MQVFSQVMEVVEEDAESQRGEKTTQLMGNPGVSPRFATQDKSGSDSQSRGLSGVCAAYTDKLDLPHI